MTAQDVSSDAEDTMHNWEETERPRDKEGQNGFTNMVPVREVREHALATCRLLSQRQDTLLSALLHCQLCCAVLCCAVLCCAVLCRAVPCGAGQCSAVRGTAEARRRKRGEERRGIITATQSTRRQDEEDNVDCLLYVSNMSLDIVFLCDSLRIKRVSLMS